MADRICSEDDCGEAHVARGMCKGRYNRWWRENRSSESVCGVDGCDRGHHAKGWCKKHYKRWQRHGDPTGSHRPTELECGTLSAYRAGCRCDECREKKSSYQQAWRQENYDMWRASQNRANRKYKAAKRDVASDPYTVAELCERDGWKCGLCGGRIGKSYGHPHPRSASVDHIVPLSEGGDDTLRNVQPAHLECNVAKGARPVGEQLRLVG